MYFDWELLKGFRLGKFYSFREFGVDSVNKFMAKFLISHIMLNQTDGGILICLGFVLFDFFIAHVWNIKNAVFLNFFLLLFLHANFLCFMDSFDKRRDVDSFSVEPGLSVLLFSSAMKGFSVFEFEEVLQLNHICGCLELCDLRGARNLVDKKQISFVRLKKGGWLDHSYA